MKYVVANILSNRIRTWWFIRLFIHIKILPLLQPSFCSLNSGSSEHPVVRNHHIYENKIQCDWILRTARNHVLKLRLGYLLLQKIQLVLGFLPSIFIYSFKALNVYSTKQLFIKTHTNEVLELYNRRGSRWLPEEGFLPAHSRQIIPYFK